MENKELTGYPSIDKPWNKYYRNSPIRHINAEQTIYELVFVSNTQNMDDVAISYMESEWSYNELKEKVDIVARALYHSGLRCRDVVLIGLLNCPEVVILLLALNKIGVVSRWFDVRAGEKDIEKYINESNCKFVIAFDIIISKIERIIDRVNVEKVLIVSAKSIFSMNSSDDVLDIPLPKGEHFSLFWKFIENEDDKKDIQCISFDKNRPSIMVQSSGTTGKPKVIVHSDYSAASCSKKMAWSDLPLGNGKVLLCMLPPWIAYALGQMIIFPLSVGSTVVLCPTFEPDAILPYIGKFTVSFAAPFHYRYLREHFSEISDKQLQDYTANTECFASGGDKITVEENKDFENYFHLPVINGYGNNEGWGCLTVSPVRHNVYGSVGIPKYEEIVISYDNDTKKELPYGKTGEICFLTDTSFLYYENNKSETDAVKIVHPDGKVWLHTGDLGYISEDGFVYLQGRIRRVIIRRGFKISAYTIEDKICECPYVKECVAVEVPDQEEEHVPMAFIVLKDNTADEDGIRTEIYERLTKELKEYEIPKYIKFVEALPYTENGKYDFRLLEKNGNDYVSSIIK